MDADMAELLGVLADLARQLEGAPLSHDAQRDAGWVLRASLRQLARVMHQPDPFGGRDPDASRSWALFDAVDR